MEFQQTGKELMEQLQGFNGRVEAELKTQATTNYRMCPRGELYIRKKRGREYFYEKCREGERSVSGNREKVSKLVRKRVFWEPGDPLQGDRRRKSGNGDQEHQDRYGAGRKDK